MKRPLKILAAFAVAGLLLTVNTSCTSTEAAIVGGLAGAAIGAALADDHSYHGHGHRRGSYGYGGGYGGGYGYRGPSCPPPYGYYR